MIRLKEKMVEWPKRYLDPVVTVLAGVIAVFMLGAFSALWFFGPEEMSRRAAHAASVELFRECEKRFADPKRVRGWRMVEALGGCDYLSDLTLENRYQIELVRRLGKR